MRFRFVVAGVSVIAAVLLLVPPASAQGFCFQPAVNYGVGSHPQSVFAADLDGDGDQDLVVANSYHDNVSVLKNNGDGTFADTVNYPVGDGPTSVFAVDLDGDGDADLAVTNYNNDNANVSVLKNKGDGTFADKMNYSAWHAPVSVFAADLDGDGDADLATASAYTVSVLINNSDGTFMAEVPYPVIFGPNSVVAADLDGDGKLDLATANNPGDNVSVLKNNGAGTFAAAGNPGVGDGPVSVFAADLNGDGKLDLAVANLYSHKVSVLKNNGDGTFATTVNYTAGISPSSVVGADLDGDGDVDLAVANNSSGKISVLENNGDGTFADTVNYTAGISPYSVFAADLDGDGDKDLAVANPLNDKVSVLINCCVIPNCTPGIDSDGDGLEDCWEINGYDANGDGIVDVDLLAMGADPRHKDIFVEVDWMAAGPGESQSHAFKPEAQAAAVAMFGGAGINLHIDAGQGGPFTEGKPIPHDDDLNPVWTDFNAIKASNFDARRARIFHYCIFGHKYSGGISSGISNGIPGHDFTVTLGEWSSNPGTIYQQAGTFVHELGHNLNLHHGGADDTNYKPNFLSVMNYLFQMSGLIINGTDGNFTYSNWNVPLDETILSEQQGINGPSTLNTYSTLFQCGSGAACVRKKSPANGPIDWNCDGTTSSGTVLTDVTCDGAQTALAGNDDWSNLNLAGGLVAATRQAQATDSDTPELTEEEYMKIAILHGDMNDDKVFDVFDVVALIDYVFSGAQPPDPIYRASVDCVEAQTDVFDVIYLIDYVFAGGPYPCY